MFSGGCQEGKKKQGDELLVFSFLIYELRGEQYYPMLEISEQTNYEIGKYGHLYLDFIKTHRRGTYTTLLTENHLKEHLHSIDEQKEIF